MKSYTNARAYIFWSGVWRHVHVIRKYEQETLFGKPVQMLEFKLSKGTKISYAAELTSFHKTAPKKHKPKTQGLA